MGDVVGLREDSIFQHGEPDLELAAWLDELAAAARSGSLRALAYVTISNERGISTGWIGHCDRHDMIAGLSMVNHRLLRDANLDAE